MALRYQHRQRMGLPRSIVSETFASSASRNRHRNSLDLHLAISSGYFDYEIVLPDKATRRPIKCDESRQINSETLFQIRRPNTALLQAHLPMNRRRDKPHCWQRSGGAITSDRCKNSSIDVRISFSLDLPLDCCGLRNCTERKNTKKQNARGVSGTDLRTTARHCENLQT